MLKINKQKYTNLFEIEKKNAFWYDITKSNLKELVKTQCSLS